MMDDCDCGYCGKCREQWQHEVDCDDGNCWDFPKEEKTSDEMEVYYWRV